MKNNQKDDLVTCDTFYSQMPEEQAFCVLLKIMYDYGLRELYKDGFDCLYLRLYQLNRLMEVSSWIDLDAESKGMDSSDYMLVQ